MSRGPKWLTLPSQKEARVGLASLPAWNFWAPASGRPTATRPCAFKSQPSKVISRRRVRPSRTLRTSKLTSAKWIRGGSGAGHPKVKVARKQSRGAAKRRRPGGATNDMKVVCLCHSSSWFLFCLRRHQSNFRLFVVVVVAARTRRVCIVRPQIAPRTGGAFLSALEPIRQPELTRRQPKNRNDGR